PEFWDNYNTLCAKDDSFRVFPLSNWTEIDIWRYIQQENIPVVPLYFSKERPVIKEDNKIIMIDDERLPVDDKKVEKLNVRFRTLGCYPLTQAIESNASTVSEIIQEISEDKQSERHGRLIDHDEDSGLEQKKKEGYF
ncbi:MAG: phosphoadenosine phosphosulfate reductase family protein, partial [Proteobacteria bacterium]|nr:phosphoadenosine phosphosulfate reductase family protein [Pseudomonadota bacterium]